MKDYIDDFLLIKKYHKDKITNYQNHLEAKEYGGCEYQCGPLRFIQRTAKITPKKIGRFVTLWKRDKENMTAPFSENDIFDFLIILCFQDRKIGHFQFPKKVLRDKGILSSQLRRRDGKRGFRVYTTLDIPLSKQAISTQAWQQNYFSEGCR